MIFVVALIGMILAPLAIALQWPPSAGRMVVETVITIVFLLDIVVVFHSGCHLNRQVCMDPKIIASRYRRGRLWIDSVAALPFFLIPAGSALVWISGLRAGHLLRVLKISAGSRTIDRLKRARVNPNLMRLVSMIFWLLMTAHIIACGMIIVKGVDPALPDAMRYLQAFYWTITTLATVGYGDITPDPNNPLQLIFTVVTQLVGVGMYGFVIGNISTVIANLDIAKTQYREKMERINTFLKFRVMPTELTKRINDYYDYLWESRRGYDESTVIDELPFSLRVQVVLELHREIIAKVPIFKGASPAFVRDIVLNMTSVVYTPGDYVVRNGELGEEMFFISRGSVDVVSEDETVVYATLSEGQFFGEIALLLSTPRTATIKARDYCDLYSLNKTTFDRVLSHYPDFGKMVKTLAEQRKRETEAASKK